MTHNGYSFKRPTLKSNYIQLLSTVKHLNDAGYYPTKSELRKAVTFDIADGWNEGRGFRKILQNLTEKGYIEEDKEGTLEYTNKGFELIRGAAFRTIRSF